MEARYRLEHFELYQLARQFRRNVCRIARINGYIAYLQRSKPGTREA